MAQRHSRGDSRGSRAAGRAPDADRTAGRDRGSGPDRVAGADRAASTDRSATPGRKQGAGDRSAKSGRATKAGRAPNTFGPPPVGAAQRARLRELIEPVIATAGYDLEDLSLSRAGRRHLVRVTVDGDGGINLDAVAEVSRLVSASLDAAEAGGDEIFAGEYELQVSSPGVDRPLTAPRHWRRNVGRLVQVRAGDRQLTGRIVESDERGVVLEAGGERHDVPFDALGAGKIQLEFTRLAALSDADLEDMLDPVDDVGDTGGDAIDDGHDDREEQEEDEE